MDAAPMSIPAETKTGYVKTINTVASLASTVWQMSPPVVHCCVFAETCYC